MTPPYKKSRFEKNVNFWKSCDVNNLAVNFHRLSQSQYQRIGNVYLKDTHLTALFPKKVKPDDIMIESISIRFALDKKYSQGKEFNFRPIISVKLKNKTQPEERQFYFNLNRIPQARTQQKSGISNPSAEVPIEFKEVLNQNWINTDAGLVDNLFGASLLQASDDPKDAETIPKRTSQRLLGYNFRNNSDVDQVNKTFFDFLNENTGKIRRFVLHLGMDMNKQDRKDQFTFSPIIEVLVKPDNKKDRLAILDSIHQKGLRSRPSLTDADSPEVYYEYMMPCPSTC